MKVEQRDLVYGSKILTVSINPEAGTAGLRFGTRGPSLLHPRIEGETTTLFKLGEDVIKEVASVLRIPIKMKFDTASTKLKLWVFAHQEDLQFDTIEPRDPESYRITVTKTYGTV